MTSLPVWDEGLGKSLPSVHISKPHALKDRKDADIEAIAKVIAVKPIEIKSIRHHIALPESDVNLKHCRAIADSLIKQEKAIEHRGVLWHPEKFQQMQSRSPASYGQAPIKSWIDPAYRTWRSPEQQTSKSRKGTTK